MRAAYNADREAFVDKVKKLEREIESKEILLRQKEEKERLIKQDIETHKNEINFWNGKCSTLKRDLEYFERYNTQYKEQNLKLQAEFDSLQNQMGLKDKETALLRKQISGLQEDNERIGRMYKVIERDAFQEKPTQARVMASEPKKEEQKGIWKVADDDHKTPLFK